MHLVHHYTAVQSYDLGDVHSMQSKAYFQSCMLMHVASGAELRTCRETRQSWKWGLWWDAENEGHKYKKALVDTIKFVL